MVVRLYRPMWLHIDPSSGSPIYRRIVDLAVTPNTIAKAYQELERLVAGAGLVLEN